MLKPLLVALALSSSISALGAAAAALRPIAPAAFAAPVAVERTLQVQGSAEIQVVPDVAEVHVTVEGVSTSSAAAAQAQAEARAAKVLASLGEAGIPAVDLRAADFAVNPEHRYDRNGNAVGVLRWRAVRRVVVCVRDLTKLGAVTTRALEQGRVDHVTFDTTRLSELRKQARALAVRAAREKAVAMADEAGARVGLPRSLSEGGDHWSGAYSTKNVAVNAGGDAFVDGALAPGKMVVSATVSAVFDVVP